MNNARFRSIKAALLATLLAAAASCSGCTTVFFQPDRVSYLTPAQAELTHEDVFIDDGFGPTLHAWWFAAQPTEKFAPNATLDATPLGTILFLHGNAQNISAHIAGVHWLPKAGYNLLMLDYRGYGRSKGAAHLPGALQDIERALLWLSNKGELRAEQKVVVYGQSLGGALGIVATSKSEFRPAIDGIISESAFANFRRISREKLAGVAALSWLRWPLSGLITGSHDPEDAIGKLAGMPVLLMHGKADVIVPHTHAEALYEQAAEPKTLWLSDMARHIQMARMPEWRQQLLQWLAKLSAEPAQ